jgi:hypothetical protein
VAEYVSSNPLLFSTKHTPFFQTMLGRDHDILPRVDTVHWLVYTLLELTPLRFDTVLALPAVDVQK